MTQKSSNASDESDVLLQHRQSVATLRSLYLIKAPIRGERSGTLHRSVKCDQVPKVLDIFPFVENFIQCFVVIFLIFSYCRHILDARIIEGQGNCMQRR